MLVMTSDSRLWTYITVCVATEIRSADSGDDRHVSAKVGRSNVVGLLMVKRCWDEDTELGVPTSVTYTVNHAAGNAP